MVTTNAIITTKKMCQFHHDLVYQPEQKIYKCKNCPYIAVPKQLGDHKNR